MSDDDNVPYRQTEEYLRAALKAAEQNERQRRGAQYGASHFPDEPWEVPLLNILFMEVNSPYVQNNFAYGSSDRPSRSVQRLSRLAGHATTWEVSYSAPYARRALAEIQYDGETDE